MAQKESERSTREVEHLARIASLESEAQRLQELGALPSKLASLKHDVIFLKKSVELAQEEAKLANKAKAQARHDMKIAFSSGPRLMGWLWPSLRLGVFVPSR